MKIKEDKEEEEKIKLLHANLFDYIHKKEKMKNEG
jgi:hypothetical protein